MTRRLTVLTAATFLAGCAVGTLPEGSNAIRFLPAEPSASFLYVALGDSTVEGVGASAPGRNYVSLLYVRLREAYPRARLINLGAGGATAGEVLNHQLPRALELRPDLVTLSVGPNDITRERALEAYARDVEATIRALTRLTTAVLVVNLIPDLSVTPRFSGQEIAPLVRERVVAFNEVLSRQARASGAEVVDLYGASQREVPRRPELIGVDRYHPSDEGYARWAELMWAGIETRLPR
jgi:acyl-CoA thioesterase-1